MSVDLGACFGRIGYAGPRDSPLATLRELHYLHLQAIPFENLDPLPKRPVDYELGSWFTSANSDSIFVMKLIGTRCEPGKRYTLCANQLAVRTIDGSTQQQRLGSVGELRDALTDLFQLRLDQLNGLDPVLAKLAAGA